MYKQVRKAIQQMIKVNKSVVDVENVSESMIENNQGELIPDPFGVKVVTRIKCRIAYQKAIVEGIEKNPSGLGTNLSQYILTDYKTPIKKGGRFNNFEIGKVQELSLESKTVGYQAELINYE